MIRRPPTSTRTDTLFPYTTLFRSQAPADQLLHDLVGAAIDARHPRPAPGTRDRIFVHIARAAVELEAFVHDLPLQFRSEERCVGKECVSTCRSMCSPYHYKQNN